MARVRGRLEVKVALGGGRRQWGGVKPPRPRAARPTYRSGGIWCAGRVASPYSLACAARFAGHAPSSLQLATAPAPVPPPPQLVAVPARRLGDRRYRWSRGPLAAAGQVVSGLASRHQCPAAGPRSQDRARAGAQSSRSRHAAGRHSKRRRSAVTCAEMLALVQQSATTSARAWHGIGRSALTERHVWRGPRWA